MLWSDNENVNMFVEGHGVARGDRRGVRNAFSYYNMTEKARALEARRRPVFPEWFFGPEGATGRQDKANLRSSS
jgi:hypothetical protein